jgi:hypothetical protein
LSDTVGPAHRVLLDEACRIADRLDRLDALLAGRDDGWLRLSYEGDQVTVVVDALLAESRQQATALRGLVAELRQASAKTSKPAQSKAKGAGVADLSSRIAARRGAASG